MSDVSLGDIMAQLQCMDACLDTLTTELYQVNVLVGCIARQQAIMGGFAPEASPPPSLVALILRMMMMVMPMMLLMIMMEMLALSMRCLPDTFTLCLSCQKGGVVLDMRVVILRGRVSIGHFC